MTPAFVLLGRLNIAFSPSPADVGSSDGVLTFSSRLPSDSIARVCAYICVTSTDLLFL
eukprot:CAMPEP_0202723198 /NCGR_PEP_ID=MMETSP1385-20130828/163878_1 /ASSEMBLY_ACC=CAM_ASM_000861 /TAXON_ID=933848 /ORGANISM="Elphidium margaritaceum" /LENGTH=57 /DNA_ID=CAMNT_0049388225 /DNA_START=9 /DNA_END=179 /DNA_ORIENTATION=-